MDKEYILNLLEGEEIDKLVAEKVMGWHIGTYIDYRGKSSGPENNDWLDERGRYMHRVSGAENGFYEDYEDFHLIYWHPSESILWAWDVIKKIQDKFSFTLSRDDPPTDDAHKWYCELYAKEAPWADYEVYAPTAPLAICRVALLYIIGI